MKIQQKSYNTDKIRAITTSDIDELAIFQVNKNRRYTQLQAGKLQGNYVEVNLGDVQVFREKLTAGALIEAAPASAFVPFGTLLSDVDNFSFCGKRVEKNTILQATGGTWDVNFKEGLDFVAAAFHRDSFSRNIEQLTGHEIPHNWLISKACLTDRKALTRFAIGLNNIINTVQQRPEILEKQNALRMLGDSVLKLIVNVLTITTATIDKPIKQSNRQLGIRLVVDYLHSYGSDVPTMPELCKIAKLSERNLQYGFKEYLGVTPVRYLRLLRLNGVRRELLISQPKQDKIVDVALNWGFVELGRFAGEYRQLFQELPSTTLNNVR